MTISDKGLNLIKGFEGFRPMPYLDQVGVATIGYGTTHGVTMASPPVTEEQACACLRRDVLSAEKAVTEAVHVPCTQHQFDALVSFTYNLGAGALHSSTLLKKLNAGDYAGAATEFAKWDHAGGHVAAGLTRRRHAEAALFEES